MRGPVSQFFPAVCFLLVMLSTALCLKYSTSYAVGKRIPAKDVHQSMQVTNRCEYLAPQNASFNCYTDRVSATQTLTIVMYLGSSKNIALEICVYNNRYMLHYQCWKFITPFAYWNIRLFKLLFKFIHCKYFLTLWISACTFKNHMSWKFRAGCEFPYFLVF